MPELPRLLPDYFAWADRNLPAGLAAYFLGGAGDEHTLRRNLSDLERVTIVPRALRDLKGGHTRVSLLGCDLASPMLVAPMAFQSLLHPDAEVGMAAAATAQGLGMVLSVQASQPMEQVRAAGDGCAWFQLYWQGNREQTLALATRAATAGFRALTLTIDAPVSGVRDQEILAGFQPPQVQDLPNLAGLSQPGFAPLGAGESALFDRVAHILPDWEDVAWLCAASPLPVLLKGILAADDAERAVAAGAAGIIVSNHGGRVLDGAVSTISVLPEVVAAVDGVIPVLMDGGIRRGVDVFRALALGARAVLVGRPVACGLAAGGAQGASHVLRLLRDELEIAMALAGCATLDQITPGRVRHPFGPSPS